MSIRDTFSVYQCGIMRWVICNTLHIGSVVEQLRAEGHTIDDTTLSLTTPYLRKHINPLGKYHFDLERIAKPQIRRPAKRLKPLTEVFGQMWPALVIEQPGVGWGAGALPRKTSAAFSSCKGAMALV